MNWDWEKLQERRRTQGSGGGGGKQPPDLEELKRRLQGLGQFRSLLVALVVGLILLIWLASGIYIVGADEVGVVKRFGAYDRIVQSGPHYHLPYPVETVQTPSVTSVRRIEIGFRTPESTSKLVKSNFQKVPRESLMLTGDENLVNVQFIVQYRVSDAKKFLFQISQPRTAVKEAAEAAMRDVVGGSKIDTILTTQKFEIQNECQKLLQKILDSYNSGIEVTAVKMQDVHPPEQVKDAFKDVASAREDKSTLINEARAYRNEIIPAARGKVASILNEAQAYKKTRVLEAKGDSKRFLALWREYRKAPRVTRKRLHLETMQEVLNGAQQKMIIPQGAAEGMVPYLPLDRLSGAAPLSSGKQPSSGGK